MKLREAHFMKLNSSAFRAKDDRLLKMALQGDQKALDLRFARYRRLLYDLAVGALIAHLIRLPVPLRSAIILCDIGEHGIEQASAVLGFAPNTVKVRLHRGRARLGLATRRNRARRNVCDVLIGV